MFRSIFKAVLLEQPRRFKQLLVLAADLIMAWVAVVLAVDLRFESSFTTRRRACLVVSGGGGTHAALVRVHGLVPRDFSVRRFAGDL